MTRATQYSATEWKWRIYLFVRAADNTAENRQALAEIYVNNGNGATIEEELEMLDNVVRLSSDGTPPAQAFGINTAAKTSMRDEFKVLLDSLTNARYAVVANTTLPNFDYLELVLTNFPPEPNGQTVTWQNALAYIENEFGLVPIEEQVQLP